MLLNSADLNETCLISAGPTPVVSWCADCGEVGLGWL